jgi:hypothetical protein
MTSSRHHGLARLPTAVVVTVVLLCQGTAWVHAAATPHVTCLEHGESIHLLPLGGDAHAGALPAVSAPAPAAAHDHEHCSLQGQRTTSPTTSGPSIIGASVAPAPAPILTRDAPADGLLRFAPKTSPPPATTR